MRPLIGITGSPHGDDPTKGVICPMDVTEAVYESGGQPLVIPITAQLDAIDELAVRLDGLLLSGGNDINPLYFGEQPLPGLGKVNPLRDELEIRLILSVLSLDKPVFGICRGAQILNVATGGTMYQDIYTQVTDVIQHSQNAPQYHASHTIKVASGSKLHEIVQSEECLINSYHHQANRAVGRGFKITAVAPDGIPEAFESESHRFAVGVQWHPENRIHIDEPSNRLFQAFVEACRYR
ncbi:gamma-glutamyl-gamma-aminobutyrate hydrolase family protein [Paenibacillus solisilvae]|uniref:Gamma-glutamyl-gamma-aminobutyrate hydrolase family protein n=1 Tax=Paenibacillus solisilvae TaxID=2486751 RepID=A0ABW0VXJ3_9BACL